MEKPLALLFVDIADSTQLYERVGNLRASAITQKMLLHLRLIVEVNDGRVAKYLGDGLLAGFSAADDACWAAGTMMESQPVFDLALRVGLHFGPVVQRIEDLYGDACNVAARIEALAKPGEILATEDFVDLLAPALRPRTRLLSSVSVKGKALPLRVYQVFRHDVPQEAGEGTTMAPTLPPGLFGPSAPMTLHLCYKDRELSLGPGAPRLLLGRGEGCALRLTSRRTSRQHAAIDFSRESFILTDQSTNGTFIRAGASLPIALRRDATKLVGSGLIGLGAEPDEAGQEHVVAFRCELG